MRLRLVVPVLVVWIFVSGCQAVTVQVPPEADLQGVKTVSVMATDLPNDPAPVAVLLRSEASSRIRRLLPALTLVEPSSQADAVLRMEVVRHVMSPVQFHVSVDPSTRAVRCSAWQVASLIVDAKVATGEMIRWQGLLEAGRRIDLVCIGTQGGYIPASSTSALDPYLVRDAVDQLGRRLAGYARREFRAIQNPNPSLPPEPAPDP